ncbi:BlaI/MecI/CopY family transcriptional regulator [Xylocopilactobacillus apicola]|uniref:Penicillinase repressor n=1 Tax=Xylocopilactobacillus apicola TaxID=2932184 RepID=A0AAU9D390_9LACO|nr:BlaI/MecI/CopY family transcriptional regulator [Xylocopilactobacillus apicola]BDR57913.1 hypothetical protein XA3_03540 [Xylocopilactobacillus apicola]
MERLTIAEETVMNVLWGSDAALSSQEVSHLSEELDPNKTQILMRRLRHKEFVKVVQIELRKKSLTRIYRPQVSEGEYFKSFVSKRAMLHLIKSHAAEMNRKELEKLKEFIQNLKK